MRFAVLGAGAIGAYLGAALTRGGSEVVLIARGLHLEAMRRNGVRVLSPRGDFEAKPATSGDFSAIAGADCLIVGLKANSLPDVLPQLAPLLSPEMAVLPAQNGVPWWFFQSFDGPLAGSIVESVDPDGVLTRSIPPAQIVGCVPYPATVIVEPGVIRHVEGTRFAIGEPNGLRSDRCQAISDAFAAGGLKCPIEERIRDQLWLKLIGNVAFNPVSAIIRSTLGQLGTEPSMRRLLRALMEEVDAVGAALGIELPVSVERRLEAGLAVGDHKTSMLQDIEAGKPLELDCLTGAVLEIGSKLGLDLPHVESVHACAKLSDSLRRSS
jgi:2-dehydropantoate 2-reductase